MHGITGFILGGVVGLAVGGLVAGALLYVFFINVINRK